MPKLDSLVVEIKADLTDIKRNMKNAVKITNSSAKKMANSNSLLSDGFSKLTKQVTLLVAAYYSIKKVLSVVNLAGEFEQVKLSLEIMLDSQKKSNKMLMDTIKLSQKSPFSFKEAIVGTKRLLAMGIETHKVTKSLEMLGNIAAGVGRDKLPHLILAFSQVKAKGKLMAEELNRQFSEAGVPLLEALTHTLKKSEQEVLKLISLGKVSFNDVEFALESLTTGSGKFANMMVRQSETYLGTLEKVKEKLDIIQIKLGTKMIPFLKKALLFFEKIADKMSAIEFDEGSRLQTQIESTTIKIKHLTNALEISKQKQIEQGQENKKSFFSLQKLGSGIKLVHSAFKNYGKRVERGGFLLRGGFVEHITTVDTLNTALKKAKEELVSYQNQLTAFNNEEPLGGSLKSTKKSLADLMGLSVKTSQSIRDGMISATDQWSEHLTDAIIKGGNMFESLARIAQRTLVQEMITNPFIGALKGGINKMMTPSAVPTGSVGTSAMSNSIVINNTFNPNVQSTMRAEIANAAPLIAQSAIAGMRARQYNGQA